MASIDTIWKRIKAHEGEVFRQIRGKPFRYSVYATWLVPEGINQNIPRSRFDEAANLLPLADTVPVQHLRGPSYIYAILMDDRIRGADQWCTEHGEAPTCGTAAG